jgi:hypothetical protein
MGAFLRWGNWAVAKLIMVSFDTGSLTDVGCTMRLVPGPAARSLLPHYTLKNNAFGPEMMLLAIIGGWRVVQLPVNFRGRKGGPGTTESFSRAFAIGLRMISLVLRYRLRKRAVVRQLAATGVEARPRWSHNEARPGGQPAPIFPAVRRMRLRGASEQPTRESR